MIMVEYNENINYYLYNYFFNNEKYLSLIYQCEKYRYPFQKRNQIYNRLGHW